MGAINKFDSSLNNIISNYKIENYVETGLGEGMCLSFMSKYPQLRKISVEIQKELYDAGKIKFPNNEVYLGNSVDVLKQILPTLKGNTLFFLDAHFPGADFHFRRYEECVNDDSKLPLQKELEIICSFEKDKFSVIIIDDLRIYMDGPYSDGNWRDRKTLGSSNPGFIFDILTQYGYQVSVNYADQGYVIGYKL